MTTRDAMIGIVVAVALSAACAGGPGRAAARTTADPAPAPSDFDTRVARYMQVHEDMAAGIPSARDSADVGANQDSRDILAARIQASRRGAKQGDIFTPPIAARFRELLNPVLRGSTGADARAVIRDDAPAKFTLHVNDRYPSGTSFPTVPVNVLAVLPVLPDGLEYRIVDRHLLLRDVRANLIVDYIFDVMCATC